MHKRFFSITFRDMIFCVKVSLPIYDVLLQKNMNTYMDENLQIGDEISPAHLKSLKAQRFQSSYSQKKKKRIMHHPHDGWMS